MINKIDLYLIEKKREKKKRKKGKSLLVFIV